MGTLIGTPPNLIFAGALTSLFPNAPTFQFVQWLPIGIPILLTFIPIIWLYLTRWIFPVSEVKVAGGREYIAEQLQGLGKMRRGERLTLWLFIATALALIFRGNINLGSVTIPGWTDLLGISAWVSDTTVMIFAALLMFAIPVNWSAGEFLLDWSSAVKIPWSLLLLFGGGIALADAFQTSGLAAWLGSHLTQLSRLPVALMILLICLLVTFLTEVTSNTAITTILMPIMASTAVAMQTHPFLLMIPATISASCAFMLPVATPPNAVIFGSGYLAIGDMAKAGLMINLIGAVLITLIFYGLIILEIIPDTFPPWALPL
jgi:sodium-dependent dicarboxylate transporter 2/3/5